MQKWKDRCCILLDGWLTELSHFGRVTSECLRIVGISMEGKEWLSFNLVLSPGLTLVFWLLVACTGVLLCVCCVQ